MLPFYHMAPYYLWNLLLVSRRGMETVGTYVYTALGTTAWPDILVRHEHGTA